MVNIDLISIIVFYGLLILFFFWKREKFIVQAKVFAMYRTRLGIKLMDKIAKTFPRAIKVWGKIGVVVGFGGMAFIFYFLIKETLKFVTTPGSPPPLAPVLPGVQIPGAPVLSFWHWIIAIFIVAVVHEFSHGMLSRAHGIKIKSSGFAFFGPILAAFVEPDEKQMRRKSKMKQLSVLAAGPFSNIVLGFLFLFLLIGITGPAVNSMFQPGGVIIGSYIEGYPAEETGLEIPFTITQINGMETMDFVQFMNATQSIKPGDEVMLQTDKGNVELIAALNPENESKGFLGISGFQQKAEVKKEGSEGFAKAMMWINLLITWLFLINVGVGLFNLLPLGPVDGGRMFILAAKRLFGKEKTAMRAFSLVSWFCLLLIFINLWPWVVKLFMWLVKGFALVVTLL